MIPNKIEYGMNTGVYCMTHDVKMQHSIPNVSSNKKQPTTFTLITIVRVYLCVLPLSHH